MKKIVLILLIVLIALGVIYYMRLPAAVKPIARLVPQDACLYFSLCQGRAIWEKIEGSEWWKSISQSEGLAKAREKIESSASRQALELGLNLQRENLLELLGEEIGVAIIPGVRSSGILLVLARTSSSLSDEIVRNLESSGLYQYKASSYRGTRMLLLRATDGTAPLRSICRIGDILAFSVSDNDPLAVLRQVVDLARSKGKGSLAGADSYRQVISMSGETHDSHAVGYFSFSQVNEDGEIFPGGLDLPSNLTKQLSGAKNNLLLSLKQMKAGGGVAHFKDGLQITLYYLPDSSRMDETSRELLRKKPRKFKALKLIPADQMLYSASLCGDAQQLWRSFAGALEQASPVQLEGMTGSLDSWEATARVSIEKDVLPLVGDEIAYCLGAPGSGQLLPIPVLGLIVKIKDVEKMKGVMNSMMTSLIPAEDLPPEEGETSEESGAVAEDKKPPSLETETYKGHLLTFIPAEFIGIRPVYAFLGDFIVISSNSTLMKTIVDVWLAETESVRASAFYESLSEEFGEVANSLTFINMGRSLDYLDGLSQFLSSLMSFGAAEGGGRTDFAPFLNCLRVVQYIYAKTDTSEEMVKQVIVVKTENLQSQ